MTRYFFDTEFLEGPQKKMFGYTKPTIDLISIGMVDENGRKFYAISNEFNLKEAWNRFDLDHGSGDQRNLPPRKIYWIRENVLNPIFKELFERFWREPDYMGIVSMEFNLENLKCLIKKYGMSNNSIANSICAFIYGDDCGGSGMSAIEMACKYEISDQNKRPEFYAYFADYDWVVFCQLFGNMMKLPKGFSRYCRDLKQMLDEKLENRIMTYLPACKKQGKILSNSNIPLENKLIWIKSLDKYPTQENAHNALDDAMWNVKLYDFIKQM